MKRFYFQKLVRDKIVNNCLNDPEVTGIDWHILSENEYLEQLVKKVTEEVEEIPISKTQKSKALVELADLWTAYNALRDAIGFSQSEVDEAAQQKTAEKGDFSARHYIESVDLADQSDWVEILRKQPQKYPEQNLKEDNR